MSTRTFGAQSMVAPLRDVLVKRPAAALAAPSTTRPRLPARRRPGRGPARARRADGDSWRPGATVHELDAERDPDLTYTFDPALVTDRGVVPLRPGKPNRRGEEAVIERWCNENGIPTLGRIEAPGTAEGGDSSGWTSAPCASAGRFAPTAPASRQLRAILEPEVEVEVFDVPYFKGAGELVHLMSVISPVADDLAVVFLPLLPVGLWSCCNERGVRLVEVPERGVPLARLQRAGGAARCGRVRRRKPGHARRLEAAGSRCTPSRPARSASTAAAGRPA